MKSELTESNIPNVTLNMHVSKFLASSVDMHVTIVFTSLKVDPDAGEQVTVGCVSIVSTVTGSVHVTELVETILFSGQVIVGAS